MKRLKYLLALIMGLVIFPNLVSAASGKINVTGTNTAVVGNKVTVTVTLSSGTPIGSWEMSLSYDKSYLQLTSSTAEAGGTYMANVTSTTSGVKSKSYTFTFKTLKKGSTKVSISGYYVVDNDMKDMSITTSSKTIKIMTQQELEASYSKDNNLKSLGVEGFEISPAFNKDTLEYNVVVPENTKTIKINAQANDKKSAVNGTGEKEVTSGTNTFDIVVRAENGSEKTYKLTVEVKDANPINVDVNGKNYTVVKIKENLPEAHYYMEYTTKIDGFDIPAYKNDNTGVVLVGLKDSEGNIGLFRYDEEKNKYNIYKEIGINKISILPLSSTRDINGYTKGKVTISGLEVDGYYYNKDSKFAIIYGMDLETGDKELYLYDKDKDVISRYNDEYINDLEDQIKLYSYIIIGFSVILVLMFILLIAKKRKKKKVKKEVTLEPTNEIDDKNEIVEIKEAKKNNKKKKDEEVN